MEDFFEISRKTPKSVCIIKNQNKSTNKDICDDMVLAMAYVPVQQFGATYDAENGLAEGTIFPELNKPFYGCKKRWNDSL